MNLIPSELKGKGLGAMEGKVLSAKRMDLYSDQHRLLCGF